MRCLTAWPCGRCPAASSTNTASKSPSSRTPTKPSRRFTHVEEKTSNPVSDLQCGNLSNGFLHKMQFCADGLTRLLWWYRRHLKGSESCHRGDLVKGRKRMDFFEFTML